MALMPSVIAWYISFLILAGFCSEFPMKKGLRMPAVSIVFIGFVLETLSIVMQPNENFIPFTLMFFDSKKNMFYTLPQQCSIIRALLLALISAFVVVVDIGEKKIASIVSLKSLTETVETCTALLQTSRLARTSVMQNDDLRKYCWEYYKKVDQIKQHLFNDSDYKKFQAEMRRKYRLDDFEKKSERTFVPLFDVK